MRSAADVRRVAEESWDDVGGDWRRERAVSRDEFADLVVNYEAREVVRAALLEIGRDDLADRVQVRVAGGMPCAVLHKNDVAKLADPGLLTEPRGADGLPVSSYEGEAGVVGVGVGRGVTGEEALRRALQLAVLWSVGTGNG